MRGSLYVWKYNELSIDVLFINDSRLFYSSSGLNHSALTVY